MSGARSASSDPFIAHRPLLFTVAYEMLGSAADAEDVLQDSWLRWAEVDHELVRDPRAYLVRIVTRQALNQLRTLSRRREDYVGEWLPEPLLTSPDVADDIELVEHLSIAMLTVLETLAPTERAVFVLREVFDVPYEEIAEAVGKSTAAVRQIAHRSRDHVAARRPRIRVEPAEHAEAVERLIAALRAGDIQALMDVLAPDAVAVADGGGRVSGAARRPIVGADRIARFLLGGIAKAGAGFVMSPMTVNGEPGLRVDVHGMLAAAVTLTVEGGRITRIFSIANPDKLARLDAEMALTR